MPFQVDPMLIPMFGRGNLSKKFAAGGGAKSGVTSKPIDAARTKNYASGGDVSPMLSPDKLEEFNRNMQRELEEDKRRYEQSGEAEFYSAVRPAMDDINERVRQTLEMYRMGRASEADVQRLLPFFSEYDIASQFGRTDTGGYRPSDINAPSTDRLREFIEIQKPTIDANRPDMFPYDPRGPKAQERVLQMSTGGKVLQGIAKGAKTAQKAVKEATKKREFPGVLAPQVDPVRGQTGRELVKMQRKELSDEQMELLESYKQRFPEFAKASRFMTPQELMKTISRADNVLQIDQLLKIIPDAKELSAVAKMGEPKRGWYRASTQAIMDVFGVDAPRFSSLLAAMSPQTSVESNLINTLNTWKNWNAAGRPTDERSIRAIMGSSVQGTKGEESVLEAWANNASRVLSAQDPTKVTLSGPKVDSFYRNLADDVYRVTNDAWMAGGLGVGQELFSGSPTALQLMRGDPGLTPGYIGTSARVREAGEKAKMLPSEAQETTWSVFMPLYEMQTQTGLPAREILQRGLLTPEVIKGTPDFATLLRDPTYARILEEGGYGKQLQGLQPTPFSNQSLNLSLSEQRDVERAAKRLEDLKEGRGRESRAKTISLPTAGSPESAFAYSTFETIPGRGVGHLEGLIDEEIGKRSHFSNRAAASFKDIQGRDVLQGALGLKPIETRAMMGSYRPEGEMAYTGSRYPLETQRGYASGVEVPLGRGLTVPRKMMQELTAAEALRGLVTAQRGSPVNVQIPTETGESMLAIPPRKGRIDPEAMRYSAQLLPEDMFMSDLGSGVAVVPFGQKLTEAERKLISERLGAERFVPTKFVGDYVDYSEELTQPPGSGAATRKMLSYLEPLSSKKVGALSEAARKPAGELYDLYEQTAKSRNEPYREDLMNLLRVLRDKGIPGVVTGLAAGQAFPAEEETRKTGGLVYCK